MLLDNDLLARLDPLTFAVRHVRPGQLAGERRSTKRGTSVEFADYRDYTPGDDLRRVDWNTYARLSRPYVKLFEEEEDLAVHLLLDASGSMDWGEAAAHKWTYARRLAAALGYVALTSGDRLTVQTLGQAPARFGPTRGRAQVLRFFRWIESLPASGVTDLNGDLRAYAISGGRAGLVLLLSDFFSPTGVVAGLTALLSHGHEVAALHLLSPDEVEPPLGGDLRLRDVETGAQQEVTLDATLRRRYRRRLAAWRAELRTDFRRRGARYLPVTTDVPAERVLLYDLRRAGVWR
ncbi:MAG: DUF58 domain-containing protein [Anaerolineae bacterium]